MNAIDDLTRWRDPVTFIETRLVDPETGEHFRLNHAQKKFLRRAFELTPDGRLRYPELLCGAPKKSGKTGLAALIVIYVVVVLGGRFAEAYCVANDLEQATGRVFKAITRILAASPAFAGEVTIMANRVLFASTGATITAIASDFAGSAGANPTITSFDELWGVVSERGHRLFDEMVPVPTRKISCRLTTTYAGFEGESDLLEGLHKRGLKGEEIEPALYEQPGMLMFWTNDFTAAWQTMEWREQMRQQLRPNAFLRLIENRWVTSESTFIDMNWYDECVSHEARPVLADRDLEVWVGVDASVKRDSTAIVAVTFDTSAQRVRLISHRIFQPSVADPLDFEHTIGDCLREMMGRLSVNEVRYDPYQMQALAQRLRGEGVPMVEFPQTVANLTEASTNLYELFKGRNIVLYRDAEIRRSVSQAVALETSRGWRIAKEKASHKIDFTVALAMAAKAALSEPDAGAIWQRIGELELRDQGIAANTPRIPYSWGH